MCKPATITVLGQELQLFVSKDQLSQLPKKDLREIATFIHATAKYLNYMSQNHLPPEEEKNWILKEDMICPATGTPCANECYPVGAECYLKPVAEAGPVEPSTLTEIIAGVLYRNSTDEADNGPWIDGNDYYKVAELIAAAVRPDIPPIDAEKIHYNKLKTTKEDRQLVENFMGYANGSLPEWIGWNEVMLVVERIKRAGCIVEIWLSLGAGCKIIKGSFKNPTVTVANTESNSAMEAIWQAVVEGVNWLTTQNKSHELK